jgi:tripartite-type tricarboxylate transporter receptor subunit TctC
MRVIAIKWLAAAAAALALQAHAQFPNRAITVVIPLAAGDAADTASRAMGEEISRTLKQPVVAVNRPGAGGVVAAESVAKAPKDGYTLLFAQNSALTFRPIIERQSTPYDAERDLVPLGLASRTPSVLVVRSDAPYRKFKELVEQARADPGSIRVGTPGEGSVADFCVQLVNVQAGIKLVSVPFKGAAPSIAALRGGHIEAVITALGAVSPHVKNGSFRALAISGRFPDFADVPTLKELGYKQDMFGVWLAFLAPSGVPDEARKVLASAIEQAVKSPAVGARLLPLGIVQDYRSAAQLAAEIREESELVQAVAKQSGMIK